MKKLILYSYFRSSASYRVRIGLYQKGLEFEYRAVHLLNEGGQQNKPEYLKLNPIGEVPLLVDGDFRLGQSVAILQYLDRICPAPAIFPKDDRGFAKVMQLCEIFNASTQPVQNLRVLQELENQFKADQSAKNRWAVFWIERGLAAFEKMLTETAGKFCYGDSVTAADMLLVPQVFTGNRYNVDYKKFSKLTEIYERCLVLEPFKKAHPDCQPDTPKA